MQNIWQYVINIRINSLKVHTNHVCKDTCTSVDSRKACSAKQKRLNSFLAKRNRLFSALTNQVKRPFSSYVSTFIIPIIMLSLLSDIYLHIHCEQWSFLSLTTYLKAAYLYVWTSVTYCEHKRFKYWIRCVIQHCLSIHAHFTMFIIRSSKAHRSFNLRYVTVKVDGIQMNIRD